LLLKDHIKSVELCYLEALEQRMDLSLEDAGKLNKYQRGYEGERQFFDSIAGIDALVIWDLLLKDGEYAQYDFIVIGDGTVYIFEIKNNSGPYRYDRGNIVNRHHVVIKDYRPQLERAHTMMEHFLRTHGVMMKVVSRIVFINDSFSLAGFNGDARMVFHGQLQQVVNHLKKIKPSTYDYEVGQMLVGAHVDKYPYQNVRQVEVDVIDPRLRCQSCRQLIAEIDTMKKYITCSCGRKVRREDIMLANLREFVLLKQGAFTIQEAMDWTMSPKTTVKRLLREHAVKTGIGRATKYYLK